MDDLERLVDELCCGNHSLGDVYRYLLRVSGDDEAKARREFGRFLQGELPERLLNYSRRSIEADDLSRRSNASLARALSVHEGKREPKTCLPGLSTTLSTGSTARRKLARSRKTIADLEAKRMMLGIADDYERLAQRAEERAARLIPLK